MGRKLELPPIGTRFNKWTVIGDTVIRIFADGEKAVMCRCDCGTEKPIRLYGLYSGRATSCKPCAQQERGKREVIAVGRLSLTQFGVFKGSAAARGINWNLSMEYLWNLFEEQGGRCALSGVELLIESYTKRSGAYSEITASIDRIDSSGVYEEGNVQWVHKDINNMKQCFSQTYFIEMCKNVTNKNKQDEL